MTGQPSVSIYRKWIHVALALAVASLVGSPA
jgi:hypothetical protein